MRHCTHHGSALFKILNSVLGFLCGVGVILTANAAESNEFDVEARYQQTCFACHGSGAAHAPVVGEEYEWDFRIEKGLDTLVQNTIDGMNLMPPRGQCADCSDDNIRAIVEYMVEKSK